MELKDFAKKVLDMRNAQRDYFRKRDFILLEKAKRLELEVDLLVNESIGGNLFESNPQQKQRPDAGRSVQQGS